MEKNYLAFDWPFNLLMDAFPNEKVDPENFSPPDDFMASLDYVLTTSFTDKERRILFMRYKEKMTYSAIASSPDISVSNARVNAVVVKCLGKLRHISKPFPIRLFVLLGIKEAIGQLRQKAKETAYSDGYAKGLNDVTKKKTAVAVTEDMTDAQQENIFKELNLSTRACHVLYGLGCTTVSQLKQLSIEDLQKTRDCGVKTTNEIVTALKNYGIEIPEKGTRNLPKKAIPPTKASTNPYILVSAGSDWVKYYAFPAETDLDAIRNTYNNAEKQAREQGEFLSEEMLDLAFCNAGLAPLAHFPWDLDLDYDESE